MKVIIADDEVHICSLLKHVIEWDSLGLVLLGAFQNGQDVLRQFEKEPADILICDIEMPGMNGIELIRQVTNAWPDCECVVVSGFRNFEYARTAMQYGVAHYLLKPIDAGELNGVLKSIVERSQAGPQPPTSISEQSIRMGLLDYLLGGGSGTDLETLNRKYHLHMQPGIFYVLSAVFTDIDIHSDFLPQIMSIFSDIMKQKLMDFCHEAEVFRTSPVSALVLVNYDAGQEKLMHSMLDNALREALTELGGKTQCRCFFGVGIPVQDVAALPESRQSSLSAVCKRYEDANRPIYYAAFLERWDPAGQAIELGHDARSELANAIESIHVPAIQKWTEAQFRHNKKAFDAFPRLAFDFCLAVAELSLSTFDRLDVPVENKTAFRKNAEVLFQNCSSFVGLQKALATVLCDAVTQRLSDKQQNMAVYVQQAMNYIDKHYAETITLEVIAEKLHISPVYLSVVFKSEAGMNYSKYLASARIEKSKELLKNKAMNLSQVANAVGYESTSYFTNLFRKHTGLKPSEYRRLHQHDIGD